MTVGNCGRCHEFQQIEFDSHEQLVLRCGSSGGFERHPPDCIQAALRLPALCTAPDTPVLAALRSSTLVSAVDVIPVLDFDASPIGFVTASELKRLVAAGVPPLATLSEVMSRRIVCALPETSIREARQLFAETGTAQLFVVGPEGTFLGLVTQRDLVRASGDPRVAG
jgi:predicted transcriptional regulator